MRSNYHGISWQYVMQCLAVCCVTAWACMPALATTKGLNQIVTPDIQPLGELSVSAQGQNSALGNSQQLQMELGVTKSFEVAIFQGFKPEETAVGAELALVQHGPYLLSVGVLGVQNHLKAQPYLEGGYYLGKTELIAGVQKQSGTMLPVFGAAYQLTPTIQPMVDYLGGAQNFATAGVTLTLAPNLTFNPAVYFSNSRPHRIVWLRCAELEYQSLVNL